MAQVSPIPSSSLTDNCAQQSNLDSYKGQTIEQICGKYGSVGDTFSHCAHFVSHALGTRIPGAALCSNAKDTKYTYAERRAGYCIRVDEVFNNCNNRAKWSEEPAAGTKCLVVFTTKGNITCEDPLTIGTADKHIGIYSGGSVYHYSNSGDKVRAQTVSNLKNMYGKNTVVLRCDLP